MKISFILKSIVAFFAAFSLNVFAGLTGSPSDAMDEVLSISINETAGDYPINLTCTGATGDMVCTDTNVAAAATDYAAITQSQGHFELDLLSNDPDGFKITMSSREGSNLRLDGKDAAYCNGVGGTHASKDHECVTYEIVCDPILHDTTLGTTVSTYFNIDNSEETDATASAYGALTTTAQAVFVTSNDAEDRSDDATTFRGNALGGAAAPVDCKIRFAAGETADEVPDGTYSDIITVSIATEGS
jgi:hypothetical protein